MEIVRIYKPKEKKGDIILYFDLETGGFRINGFSLRKENSSFRITPPLKQSKDGRWWPVALPINKDSKKKVRDCLCQLMKPGVRYGTTDVRAESNHKPLNDTAKFLSQEELREVAHWNLDELLGGVPTSDIKDYYSRDYDSIK